MRWLLVLAAFSAVAHAELREPRNLQTEALLHPLDGFTAYTLEQGELVCNQSPLTLPLPSWAWIGVTDWLTAEIDLLPLLGGFFVEPHAPVPSFNFRFRVRDGGRTGVTIAIETMVQHLWRPLAQEDGPTLRIVREGTSWFTRLNASFPITGRLRFHASIGATYAEDIEISNNDEVHPVGEHHRDDISPDVSLAIDFRWKPWISLHATGSVGTTFVYSDNQPRKLEVMYGFRIAPFLRSRRGILRTMRMEFPAFIIHHPESGTGFVWPVPLVPYVYWQWTL